MITYQSKEILDEQNIMDNLEYEIEGKTQVKGNLRLCHILVVLCKANVYFHFKQRNVFFCRATALSYINT